MNLQENFKHLLKNSIFRITYYNLASGLLFPTIKDRISRFEKSNHLKAFYLISYETKLSYHRYDYSDINESGAEEFYIENIFDGPLPVEIMSALLSPSYFLGEFTPSKKNIYPILPLVITHKNCISETPTEFREEKKIYYIKPEGEKQTGLPMSSLFNFHQFKNAQKKTT